MANATSGAARVGTSLKSFRLPIWAHAAMLLAAAAVVVLHIRAIPLSADHWGLFQNMVDVYVYQTGGMRVRHGVPLYDGSLVNELPFTYPPFAALLFTTLTGLSEPVLIAAWSSATMVALWLAIVVCWRALHYRTSWQLLLVSGYIAVIATWLEPVRTTIWYGQINLMLMTLIVWDLSRRRGSFLRGWSVGIAAGIKLTPGFFFVFLAVARQWRSFVTGALAFGATIAVGLAVIPSDALTFWRGTMFQSERVGRIDSPANQSITGALTHILRTPEPPLMAVVAVTAVVLVLGLTAIWLVQRSGHQLLAITLTGMTASMVSPFSWGHHWVWFIPLLIVFCDYAVRTGRRAAWIVPAALYAATACWIQTFDDPRQPTGTFYAIGTFMLLPPDITLVMILRIIYPLIYVAIVLMMLAVFGSRYLRGRTNGGRRAASSAGATHIVEPESRLPDVRLHYLHETR